MKNLLPDLRSAGVINLEMEASGQFVIGRLHGMRMGAILAVVANRATDKWGEKGGEEKASKAASEAVFIMKEWESKGEVTMKLSKCLRIDG